MISHTPLTSVFGKVGLPVSEEEPLTSEPKPSEGVVPDKCDLRIEGMTCGACVEASLTKATNDDGC